MKSIWRYLVVIYLLVLGSLLLAGCDMGEEEEDDVQGEAQEEETTEPVAPAVGSGSIIFLHHSVGASLIEEGDVRSRLAELGYEFYDHGYNEDGLVLADGTWTGANFDVPDDNTDPDGFADIFAQPLNDPPTTPSAT